MRRLEIFVLALTVFITMIAPASAEMDHGSHGSHGSPQKQDSVQERETTAPPPQASEDHAGHSGPGSQMDATKLSITGPYQIVPQIPDQLELHKPMEFTIEVRDDKGPVNGLLVHAMVAGFFGSGGHGADHESETVIQGEELGNGLYRFAWTPNQDGRLILTIVAGEGQGFVPVDVQGPAPNPYVLGFFGLFVAVTLGYSRSLRKQNRKEGPIHETA